MLSISILNGHIDHRVVHAQSILDLAERLLKRTLPLTAADLSTILDFSREQDWAIATALNAVERFKKEDALDEQIASRLEQLRWAVENSWRSNQVIQRLLGRIDELLGRKQEVQLNLDGDEPWATRVHEDLEQLEASEATVLLNLVVHASFANGSKPSAKWLGEAKSILEGIDSDLVRACLTVWITAFDQPRAEEPNHYSRSVWRVVEKNADTMKGLIWTASQFANDDLVRSISKAGLSGQKKIPGVGPRCAKVSNAAVWALSQIDNQLAIGQLAILRSKIKNKATQKVIDKAIETVAQRLQVPADEVEEMAVPTYGLTDVGLRSEKLGEFTAELIITGTTSTELRWLKPDGKPQKSVPKVVKEEHDEELKELRAAAKDIQKLLPAQRDRIDVLPLRQKTWPYAVWAERYLNHPLVGTLARRLIWSFTEGGRTVDATWLDSGLVDSAGDRVQVNPEADVALWHPIGHEEDSVIAWRKFFEEREIKQPFKQAHREVYLLTDAERNTRTYSNRYASHVLKQHQYNALCSVRGWKNSLRLCVDDEYAPSTIFLPNWNLRAEFWVEGIGEEYGQDTNESGVYHYLATDQVRFYTIDAHQLRAHAGGGGYRWGRWQQGEEAEPIPLEQIPPLVLSEVMRDVDLFVGVSSVGNDPNWQDGGPEGRHRDYWNEYSFGGLSATAMTRREILQRLVPRLKIADRCSFDDKFLVVRGDLRTYKIHLGSSNILMEPNDQYLCIVPGRGAGPGDKVFLPFEGDQRLAVVISKAMMLADDTKITDPTIISQIRR